MTAHALAFGGCLLLAGRLADLYGARRMFVAGLAVFTVASLLCGLAPTPLALVVLRALQGLGAAIVAPAALSLITSMFAAGRERSLAMGVWTAVAAGGGAAGLLLGGVITGLLGWRWVFFVNVPLGVAGVALSYVLLRGGRPAPSTTRPDVPGAVTATAGLLLLVYALTLAESSGFATPSTLGVVVALAVLLLAIFVMVERTSSAPLVPLPIFANRGLSGRPHLGGGRSELPGRRSDRRGCNRHGLSGLRGRSWLRSAGSRGGAPAASSPRRPAVAVGS